MAVALAGMPHSPASGKIRAESGASAGESAGCRVSTARQGPLVWKESLAAAAGEAIDRPANRSPASLVDERCLIASSSKLKFSERGERSLATGGRGKRADITDIIGLRW